MNRPNVAGSAGGDVMSPGVLAAHAGVACTTGRTGRPRAAAPAISVSSAVKSVGIPPTTRNRGASAGGTSAALP